MMTGMTRPVGSVARATVPLQMVLHSQSGMTSFPANGWSVHLPVFFVPKVPSSIEIRVGGKKFVLPGHVDPSGGTG